MDIGVATIDIKLADEITSYSGQKNFDLSEVTEKRQLTDLDGLILPMDQKEQLSTVIDWLLESQDIPNLFIWVFSTEQIETEEDILRKLGVNEVIEGGRYLSRLFLSVQNTMTKVSSLIREEHSTDQSSLLDTKNQGIFVEDHRSIGLTRIEYTILSALVENVENVLTYEELMEIGWPNNPTQGKYRLANLIFHLRKKIEKNAHYTIRNYRSKGYLLTKVN